VSVAVFYYGASQRDAGINVPVESEIADRACITAAPRFFQFADNLHGADFRRPRDSTGRKCRSYRIKHGTTAAQVAYYVGHDMHHMAVSLDLHELCYAN